MQHRMTGLQGVLDAVHQHPGVTRASVARSLGMPSGLAAETTTRLVDLHLVTERLAPPTGTRGRPSTALWPHPDGPLVAVAAIAHETWSVAAVGLGGGPLDAVDRPHRRDQVAVMAEVTAALGTLGRRHGRRVRAVAVAVPGTVVGTRLVNAPNLGWHDVDLGALWPLIDRQRPFLVGNDASLAALAEARRGAAAGAGTSLHLYMDAGVGGAVIEDGRLLHGATGMAGEFGHMPTGDPTRRCRCGALGCWNTTLDGPAIARSLGRADPVDEVTFTRQVLVAARGGGTAELAAVRAVARSVGRGAAGLVNAFDPHVVTVGGVGRELLEVAGDHVAPAYLDGLMRYRTAPPPPLVPATAPGNAPLVGAAEAALAAVLSEEGLRSWASR